MASLHVKRRLRRRKGHVRCQSVLSLSGEIGQNVQEISVGRDRLGPEGEHVIAFLL